MTEAFRFTGGVELPEMLGRRARDEMELLDVLEDAPLDAIHFHTAARFLRHEVLEASFPNDFAAWAAREVRDLVLAERLGVVDPFDFKDLESLRAELVATVDDHLTRIAVVPRVIYGEPFYLMRHRFLEAATGIEATDLASFEAGLARVDASAIYNHAIESRFRKNTAEGDFAVWVQGELGETELARSLASLTPFGSSIEGMRGRLVALVREARERRRSAA